MSENDGRREAWTAERRERHRAAVRARWADPKVRAVRTAAISERSKKQWEDPAFKEKMRETTRRSHAEGRIVHSAEAKERRAAGLRAFRENNPEYVKNLNEGAAARTAAGVGIGNPEMCKKSWETNKKILKAVAYALKNDPDYITLWKDTQARFRMEFPYDGPSEASDYLEYVSRLGKYTVSDPAVRGYADAFRAQHLTEIYANMRAAKLDKNGRRKKSGDTIPAPVVKIMRAVASEHGVTMEDILAETHGTPKVGRARQEAMRRVRAMDWNGKSPPFRQIATWFDRAYSVVMFACKKEPSK